MTHQFGESSKIIFVTGGVLSGLGKGVTVASIGRILKSRGISVATMKLDPYLNVDPGTMSPYQHGEVFVTEDGAETDLDLGHYERFVDENLSKSEQRHQRPNLQLRAQPGAARRLSGRHDPGDPPCHQRDQAAHRPRGAHDPTPMSSSSRSAAPSATSKGLPFLEAIRQMRKDVGRRNTLYVHVTWLPYLAASKELKTKPTQHSVRELRGIGIQPDVIVLRSDHAVDEDVCEQDGALLRCGTRSRHPAGHQPTPSMPCRSALEDAGSGRMARAANSASPSPATRRKGLADWRRICQPDSRRPSPILRIGLVGKYVELEDAYFSVKEALIHAGLAAGCDVEIEWISSEDLERGRNLEPARTVDGIVVPGGFGYRGIEGKIVAARYAREHKVPYLGLCLGMQVMCIELARHIFRQRRTQQHRIRHQHQVSRSST